MERVLRLGSQKAAVIFSTSSCCMCHAIKRLFCELGVNPAIYELDEDSKGREMEKALISLLGRGPSVPAVFIGGKLIGSTDNVMSLHLSGHLIPKLKEAGAIWL
ncbi:glutaredoxin-C1-like [Tasmannia lanceolata]|uniref:glutaredoxin-C1-like n=1 Tax=Tasmannia lanceolata TaxID=3420 RepID=UPI0040643E9D